MCSSDIPDSFVDYIVLSLVTIKGNLKEKKFHDSMGTERIWWPGKPSGGDDTNGLLKDKHG